MPADKGRTSSPVGRPDFNSGEMRNACLVGSTPMSFRQYISLGNP